MNITLAGGAQTYTPNDDQLSRVSLEFAAFDGEIGVGQLPVPDTGATVDIQTGRQAKVEEIGSLLVDGFIIDNDRVRGPIPAAAATPSTTREYTFSVEDPNALLGGFRINDTRPAETDRARMLHFVTTYLPTFDTTWILNTNTLTLPAKKFDSDGGLADVITDGVEFTGKTAFAHDKTGGGRCFHYHLVTEGHTCGLSISDVYADYNGVTVFKPGQPVRQRTAIDLVNNVKGRDQNNRTAEYSDSASIAAHDADGRKHEALIDFDADSQADLNAKTLAFLGSQRYDLDTYICDIGPLDASALALIRVGDLMTLTSTVWGLTASTQRIAHMTLTPWSGLGGPPAPGLWNAHLELGAPIRRRARIKKAVKPSPVPPPFDNTGSTLCHTATDVFADQNPLTASTLATWETFYGSDITPPTGITPTPPEAVFASGGSATIRHIDGANISNLLTFNQPLGWPWTVKVSFSFPALVPVAAAGPSLGDYAHVGIVLTAGVVSGGDGAVITYETNINDPLGPAFERTGRVDEGSTIGENGTGVAISGSIMIRAAADDIVYITAEAGGYSTGEFDSGETLTDPLETLSIDTAALNGGSHDIQITAIEITSSENCDPEGPLPGQFVNGEQVAGGDDVTTVFFTAFPYMPHSLKVWIEDAAGRAVREFSINENDPTTGEFLIINPPATGETVVVDYQGAV